MSCARDGAQAGISYTVVGEVENDVLFNEPPQPSADGDTVMEDEEPRVLSLVKKLEVELLCPQHNPVCRLIISYLSSLMYALCDLGQDGSQKGR